MKQASIAITAAFIMVISMPIMAYNAGPLDIQQAVYPSGPVESFKTHSAPGRPIDINPDSNKTRENPSVRINQMSEHKMYNKKLYRFTEKPSNYIHAIQQDYIPW